MKLIIEVEGTEEQIAKVYGYMSDGGGEDALYYGLDNQYLIPLFEYDSDGKKITVKLEDQ